MSRSTNSKMYKYQKHPKVLTAQYLYNADEPVDNIYSHISAELEAEMLDEDFLTKKNIRRNAQRLRGFKI